MARGKGGPISWSADVVFSAAAGIEGVAALALAVICVYGVLRITIRGDAARKCFLWFYTVIAVTFL
jgi:hypothetical protein